MRPRDAYIYASVNMPILYNGLSPNRRQAIIWTNAGILLIEPLGTNFNEILIEIHTFSFKKMHLKMSSGKWRPFCLGLNVLSFFFPKPTVFFSWKPWKVIQWYTCQQFTVEAFCVNSSPLHIFHKWQKWRNVRENIEVYCWLNEKDPYIIRYFTWKDCIVVVMFFKHHCPVLLWGAEYFLGGTSSAQQG